VAPIAGKYSVSTQVRPPSSLTRSRRSDPTSGLPPSGSSVISFPRILYVPLPNVVLVQTLSIMTRRIAPSSA
jgi:hypothetical protein